MSNNKTAVEWLIDQVEDFLGLLPVDLIQKAKAMEKEQIIEAHEKGGDIVWQYQHNNEANGEQYFKETYEQ